MTKRQKALRILNRAWVVSLLLCAVFTFDLRQAHAKQAFLVYEVYAGGIHAVQSKVDINFSKNGRYAIKLDAATRGFLGSIAPWSGTFESNGWVEKDGKYKPQLHKSTAIWKGTPEIKEYKYNRKGGFEGLIVEEDKKPPQKQEIDDALTQGTVDTLSAAMQVMKTVDKGGECVGSSEVFDGSRRFEQIFVHQGYEDLTPTKYNVYEGSTSICSVEVKPISGKWHEKPRGWMSIQEQGRAAGTMPTVWMGKLGKDGPTVPVKIRVKTDYGVLYMHLAEYRSGKDVLVAEKRVK